MSNDPSESQAPRRACAGCAVILVATAAFLGFRFHRMLEPADRVVVSLSNIDPSTRSFYFVVDTPAGPEEMSWYLEKVTPFTMKPRDHSASYDPAWDKTVTRPVQWVDGRRYGVVVDYEEGPSRVFWYKPEDTHLHWNSWWRGGGEASIELPEKEKGEEYRL